MPTVGFGTYLCPEEDAKVAVQQAISAGYRHIDTAESYNNEVGVGEGIRMSGVLRSELYVTTKLFPGRFGTPFKTYETTIAAFAESFDKLGLEYIDLYLIHHAFAKDERLDEWRALVDLQRSGKVKSIGVSNWGVKHLEEIRVAGLPMPVVNQIELHPLSTRTELVAYMREHGILPVAYSSLAPLSQWRADMPTKATPKDDSVSYASTVICSIASSKGVSAARVLLRWGLQHGYSVLPKSTHADRIRENLDLYSFQLSEEDMRSLDALNQNKVFAWPSIDPIDCD